jgi:RTX calcium-binding nonapeptide repeat (4 copies)
MAGPAAGGGGGGGGGTGGTGLGLVSKKGGRPVAAPVVHWGNPDTTGNLTIDTTNITLTSGTPTTVPWGKAGAGSTDTFGNSKKLGQPTGTSNDKWTGGTGTDFLDGGAGNDTLKGGLGDDVIVGGTGADRIEGTSGSEVYYGPLLNGADTGTVVIGANAPGGGGWLNPKDPASQGSPAFSAYQATIKANRNASVSTSATTTTTVTNPDGTTTTSTSPATTTGPTPTPASTNVTGPNGGLWDLTPGSGIMAGHAALVTPHWDPNSTNTATNTVTNADGSTTTTTTTTTGAFVMPAPNSAVSDSDFLLDAQSKETENFDLARSNGQVVAGFDMLFVGMSGDGNPASGTAGEVAWTAKDETGAVLSQGTLHNIAGSTTLRAGATFSADAAKHVAHLDFTPTGSTVVTPQTLGVHYLDPTATDAAREAALTNEFGSAITSHQANDALFPVSGAGSTWKIGFNADSPDIGVNYRGDILTGGDVNKAINFSGTGTWGDGAQDTFVLGTGMQDIRDFESGLDKVQVGIFGPPSPGTAATSVNDLAYAVKDALEIAYRDAHTDMLLLPQGSMLWNEHSTAWTGNDFQAATVTGTTAPLFASNTPDAAGMFHFTAGLGLDDTQGLTAAGLAR